MAIAPSQSTASTITTLSAAQSREMAAAGKMNLIAIDAMDPDLSPDQAGSENESQGPASDPPDEQLSADDSTGPASVKAEQGEDDSADVNQTTSAPAQKRRRVTRACDECRRKKIKCDGKQPCTHCSVYSYECTYDKPSNRRRNPAPQYIEALENKLARAEALLRKFIPDVDLSDPTLDPAIQHEFQSRERQRAQAVKNRREQEKKAEQEEDARITSMIETIGQLELDEGGGWDFRGASSGAVFLRRMKENFGGLLGNDYQTTFLPRPSKVPGLLHLDPPSSSAGNSAGGAMPHDIYDLPPKDRAHQLSSCALTCATALLRIVHIPTFFEKFEVIYGKPSPDFDDDDRKFLALFYAVLAVGCVYNIGEEDAGNQLDYKLATEEGMKYYTTARMLLQDITECRDLASLQALLFLILFLQATSNLSGCYAFLGIATRAALRMGLHRDLPHADFTPLVRELRRRTFYFILQQDIYSSALLGFPILLHDEDIDQQLPTEVDDEFISEEGIRTPPAGTPGSYFQAFNAHSRLMKILMKVVKYIYPLKGIGECVSGSANAMYTIDYSRIKEIEADLQTWHEQLPQRWRPSADGSIEVMRVRTLLRFAYAHVQMMLYRPFLHYISPRLLAGKVVAEDRYYACAAAGISVSRNILHIAMEIKNQTLVVGPFWSMLYTEFFAILTLVFYVLEHPDKPGAAEIFLDASAGRDMIAKMAPRSIAADRIMTSLNTLWDNLPETIRSGKARSLPSRKRSAPGPRPGPTALGTQKALSASSSKVASATSRRAVMQRPSFDTAHRASSQHALTLSSYGDRPRLDVSSTGAPTESGGATPSAGAHPPNPYLRTTTNGTQALEEPSIYQLDALMFSSNDPFAYPNQPILELGSAVSAPHAEPQPVTNHIPQTDPRNFYIQPLYGDINGRMMNSLPSYMVQSNTGQNGIDHQLPGQMYQPAPSSLAAGTGFQHTHHTHHPQQHRPNQHNAQARMMGRDIEEMMADSGFNRSWDLFSETFKPL